MNGALNRLRLDITIECVSMEDYETMFASLFINEVCCWLSAIDNPSLLIDNSTDIRRTVFREVPTLNLSELRGPLKSLKHHGSILYRYV